MLKNRKNFLGLMIFVFVVGVTLDTPTQQGWWFSKEVGDTE